MIEIDWSKVPDSYDWVAMDADGKVYAYNTEPKKSATFNWWACKDSKHYFLKRSSFCEGWRESLTHRPSAVCQEFPEHEVNDTYKAFVKHLEDVSKQMAEMQQELVQAAIEMVSLESVEKSILKSENRELRETMANLRKKILDLSHE